MNEAETPTEPPAMSRTTAIAYAISLPLGILALVFLPAGRIDWLPGWIFIAALVGAFTLSAVVLAKVNPVIYRARSRIQKGTESWDRRLLPYLLGIMTAIVPLAALDAGRFHWSDPPTVLIVLGYVALLLSIAGQAWAQAVNPYFEPGVRLQTERHQRVIRNGPYRFVRHPGYTTAILMFVGLALALGSYWALIPAAISSLLLAVRTKWEDDLLRRSLDGYADYARAVRYRLLPGIW